MKLGTKVKMVTGVIAVMVVAAYAMHVNPSAFKVNTGKDDDNWVFSSTWEPNNSTQKTHIEIKVDGVVLVIRDPRLSPWGHTAVVAKGAKVTMTVARYTTNLLKIDCMMMRNNQVPRGARNQIPGPGAVTCVA